MSIICNYKLGISIQTSQISFVKVELMHNCTMALHTPYGCEKTKSDDGAVFVGIASGDRLVVYSGDITDCQKLAVAITDYIADGDVKSPNSPFTVGNVLDVNDFVTETDGE